MKLYTNCMYIYVNGIVTNAVIRNPSGEICRLQTCTYVYLAPDHINFRSLFLFWFLKFFLWKNQCLLSKPFPHYWLHLFITPEVLAFECSFSSGKWKSASSGLRWWMEKHWKNCVESFVVALVRGLVVSCCRSVLFYIPSLFVLLFNV